MNQLQEQVLDFTSAFPPAHKLTETLMKIDYRKLWSQIVTTVIVIFTLIQVAYLLTEYWYKNGGKEKLQNIWIWVKDVAIPFLNTLRHNIYTAGMKTRNFYEVISSPLFITL